MIQVVEAPARQGTGRPARLTAEDVEQLAVAFNGGRWASDGESTNTKSAAYQRAQMAARLVKRRFKIEQPIKTSVFTKDDGFGWAIGPYADGERPRRSRKAGKDDDAEQ